MVACDQHILKPGKCCKVLQGTFDLVWSYMLDYENSINPYHERRNAIAKWRNVAKAKAGWRHKP